LCIHRVRQWFGDRRENSKTGRGEAICQAFGLLLLLRPLLRSDENIPKTQAAPRFTGLAMIAARRTNVSTGVSDWTG
jgi:hypothetical protein